MRRVRKARKGLRTVDADVLPRELQRPTPRDVALNATGWFVAVCAILLAVGGVLGAFAFASKLMADAAVAAELRSSGVATEAVIWRVNRGRDRDAQVTVWYSYSAAGQEYEGRARLQRRHPLRRTAAAGSPLAIVYLREQPHRSWLAGEGPREHPVWLAALPPVIGLPSALLIFVFLLRQRRLLADGRAAMARVISVEKRSGHENAWRTHYSWELLSGATRTAHVDRSEQPSGSGPFLPIVYDREEPERHAVYPMALVKVR